MGWLCSWFQEPAFVRLSGKRHGLWVTLGDGTCCGRCVQKILFSTDLINSCTFQSFFSYGMWDSILKVLFHCKM